MPTRPVITDLWICFLRELAYFELQCADTLDMFGLDPEDREQRRAHARNLDVLAAWVERHADSLPPLPGMNAPASVK